MSDDPVSKAIEAAELLKPIANLLERLLGSPFDETGQLLAVHLRARRIRTTIRLAKKLQQELRDSGLLIQEDPDLNVIVPLIEKASLVEEEELSDRWARLLATAMTTGGVHPAYPEILSQITAQEARILDFIFDRITEFAQVRGDRFAEAFKKGWAWYSNTKEGDLAQAFNLETFELRLALDNLIRVRLVTAQSVTPHPGANDMVYLTAQAFDFIRACRGPAVPPPEQED